MRRNLDFAQWLAGLLLVPALAWGSAAWAADAPDAATDFDARMQGLMREGGLVGAGAAILVGPEVRWLQGYGWADREQGIAFTPDTVMNIASISKTVTGVALLQAVEAGRLDLDRDVNDYLPFRLVNPHAPGGVVTLRHLATHTSGITDRPAVYARGYVFGRDPEQALGSFLAGYLVPGGADYDPSNFLAFAPGTHRDYSNIGAALAGYIVERATGQRLDEWTRQHVFQPLRMERSAWWLSQVPRHARLYVVAEGMAVPILPYGLVTYPDGGVRTSVADLSRFFAALLGGGEYEGARILSPRMTAEMRRFQYVGASTPGNVDPAKLNSGIFWSTKLEGALVGHGGSDPGLETVMLYDPKADVGVVLFTNTAPDDAGMKAFIAMVQLLRERGLQLKAQAR